MSAFVTALLVKIVRGYQILLSPMLGQRCRFYPSCSHYALEALRTHGAARGSLLTVRRLCKCHPFNEGGVDPVPPAQHPNSSTAACGCNHS